MPQWVFYLMAVLFDGVTCLISTFYLMRSASGISRFVGSGYAKWKTSTYLNSRSMSAMVKMYVMD